MKPLTAFHNWHTALAQLESALDTFLDACTVLGLACSETTPEVKCVVERLCDRLDRLGAIDRKMATSRAIMLGIRIGSTVVVPVAKLPPELLTKVFAHCVDHDCRGREIYQELHPYPIDTIIRVCSRWRRIALSTPSLWSLVIADYDLTHRRPSHIPTSTRLRLERSKNVPLNVYIHSTLRQRSVKQLVPILRPHLSRVSRLVFHSVKYDFIDALFPRDQISPPALSALCLNDIRGQSEFLQEHGWSIWPAIHGLQKLELVNLDFDICPKLEQLGMVLARSPNLQTLRIGLESIFLPSSSINQPDIHLPALNRLEIGPLGHSGVPELLSMLRVSHPELNVTLELPHRHDDQTALSIKTFLQRSDVAVVKLRPSLLSVAPGYEHYLDSLLRCHTLTLEFSLRPVIFDPSFTLENLSELRVLNILGGEIGHHSWSDIIAISETGSLARIAFSKSVKFLGTERAEVESCDWANQLRQRVGEVVFEVDGFDD